MAAFWDAAACLRLSLSLPCKRVAHLPLNGCPLSAAAVFGRGRLASLCCRALVLLWPCLSPRAHTQSAQYTRPEGDEKAANHEERAHEVTIRGSHTMECAHASTSAANLVFHARVTPTDNSTVHALSLPGGCCVGLPPFPSRVCCGCVRPLPTIYRRWRPTRQTLHYG